MTESRAKILGHAAHQMLIVVPLGMFTGAVVFDGIYYFGGRNPRFADAAYWMIVTGVLGGLAAAVPGWIDWTAIRSGTRAKVVGLWHGLGNTLVVIPLFAASWYLRKDDPANPSDLAMLLSTAGFAAGGVTAWLGGELVDRLGIGVDPGAHADAPNSLSGRPATDRAGGAGLTGVSG